MADDNKARGMLLGLRAQTFIHAGAGATQGVVDLPIQREAHSGWPVIFGSGVKGALRSKAVQLYGEWKPDRDGREKLHEPLWVSDVFGRDPNSGGTDDYFAGALAVGDARLLLLPVRSLSSHFKWVTCPALLERFRADAERLSIEACHGFSVSGPASWASGDFPEAWSKQVSGVQRDNKTPLFLEEFRFDWIAKPAELDNLIECLAPASGIEAALLNEQLVVIGNDLFAHICQHATPVAAHVAINNENKTVKSGALWYEETLPPDTVMYSCLIANPGRKQGSAIKSVQQVVTEFHKVLKPSGDYLQIGGNETVGMGWFKTVLREAAP